MAFAAIVFVVLGVGCFAAGESETVWLGIPFLLVGVFLTAVGCARFFTRVVVTADGMTRSPWFPNGFTVSWADVENWRVMRTQSAHWDHPMVVVAHFVLGRGKRPIQVALEDVNRPGFDSFLRDVRRFIGGRER